MSDPGNLLRDSAFLRLLPTAARADMLSCFTELHFKFGDPIVTEGEPADSFYVIVSGRARVVKQHENGEEVHLTNLAAGDSFGEIGLLSGGLRTATVRASEPVCVLRLEKEDFDRVVGDSMQLRQFIQLQLKHRSLQGFLREYTRFSAAPLPVLERILQLLRPAEYHPGETVIRQGEEGGSVFIVEKGRLTVYRDEDDGEHRVLGYLRPGDYFGELSLLQGSMRCATVEAQTDCLLHVLSPRDWETLLNEHPELQELVQERIANYHGSSQELRVPLDFQQGEADWAHAEVSDAYEPITPPPPPAAAAAEPLSSRTAAGRVSFVPQIDEMDCGVAALAMICSYFGRQVKRSYLREITGATAEGTGSRDISSAARELGLDSEVVKKSPGQLGELPCPAMLHFAPDHWVVLMEVREDKVRIADPAKQIHWISRDECLKCWSGFAVLFHYTERFDEELESDQNAWAWLRPIITKVRWPIAATAGLTLLICSCQILLPIFIQRTIDHVIGSTDLDLLSKLRAMDITTIYLVLALALTLILMLLQRHILARCTIRLDRGILDHILQRMLQLPLLYFLNRRPSDIQQRLIGAREIRYFIMENCSNSLLALVQVLAFALVMFVFSPRLALWFLVIMLPVYLILLFLAGRILRPAFAGLQETEAAFQRLQDDVINGIRVVKSAGGEQQFRDAAVGNFLRITRHQAQNQFNISAFQGTVQGLWVLSSILFLWFGARYVIKGDLTLGRFIAFHILIAMLYAPVMSLIQLWVDYLAAGLWLQRLNDIIQWRSEEDLSDGERTAAASLQGRVEFRDVSIHFGGSESAPILESISFTANPGQRIGILGRSGSGKTVLAKTIAALLQPSSGRILYDDVPETRIRLPELRRQIGLVLEDEHLFNGTVLANIAFGDSQPDAARAKAVARTAGFHEQIDALPNGYRTEIGDGGVRLDLGLRQGIAITRALYHDPAILVVDDATGALDVESESVLLDNLEEALQHRTVIFLSQRPGLVRRTDRIFMLDHGRIVEQGTHDELMERRGLYYHLTTRQMD